MARRKSDEEKGPIGAWATRQRERRDWKPADVIKALARVGAPITEGTYRGIEAGPRPPSRQLIAALERVFESEAPDPHQRVAEPQSDVRLIEALERQTAAIERLAMALEGRIPDPEAQGRALGEALGAHLRPLLDALSADQHSGASQ